uniref:Uncharacterized protein AlNc14C4G619 n=1 Tax=Albugo laibachii Nc14 TaxID=890382 RepID=F0W0H7_9STRA|nr:conserved hypothetical protein [Albugo laibachii Nc14]|eukprot:CCA14549.1 conserved hypothetical protein [Albugo laibachii Nc14]
MALFCVADGVVQLHFLKSEDWVLCATLKSFRIGRRFHAFTMQHEWDTSSSIPLQYADLYWPSVESHPNAVNDVYHTLQRVDNDDMLNMSASPIDRSCPKETNVQFASTTQQIEKSLMGYASVNPSEWNAGTELSMHTLRSFARVEVPHELSVHDGWMHRYNSLWEFKQSNTMDSTSTQQNLQPLIPLLLSYERCFTPDEIHFPNMLSVCRNRKMDGSREAFIEPGLNSLCKAHSNDSPFQYEPRWQGAQRLLQGYEIVNERLKYRTAVDVQMSGPMEHPPSALMQWMPTTWSECLDTSNRRNDTFDPLSPAGSLTIQSYCERGSTVVHAEGSTTFIEGIHQERGISNSPMEVSQQESSNRSRIKSTFRRCSSPGCDKGARGKSGRCQKHGGGKRCIAVNCTKGAQGSSKNCLFHGGGYRCTMPGCNTGARGTSGLCARHGGCRRANKTNKAHLAKKRYNYKS